MTAEISIMNKMAVALAADSAVTIRTQTGEKIYNTVNKLFTLSKYHPVGIMVYGNAELMEVPWESIIKVFRTKLGSQRCQTLREYATAFISYLNKANPLFPPKVQEEYFKKTIGSFFNHLKDRIDEKVKSIIVKNGKIDDVQILQIVNETILERFENWSQKENLKSLPRNHDKKIINKYAHIISEAKVKVFGKLPVSKKSHDKLIKMCGFLFSKNIFLNNTSGIVIAGFGDKDTFPSLFSFDVEAVVDNKLKYRPDRISKIDIDRNAAIVPFAQSEMVHTFMQGIDPMYTKAIKGYLSKIFDQYPEYIINGISNLSKAKREKLNKKLKAVGSKIVKSFDVKMNEYGREKHVNPILDAVQYLPKDELAAMAESLVNLTSFKRKVTMDVETVGGPIDVAVISKGDGFIWIKRKHYFNTELNQHFIANYFR